MKGADDGYWEDWRRRRDYNRAERRNRKPSTWHERWLGLGAIGVLIVMTMGLLALLILLGTLASRLDLFVH